MKEITLEKDMKTLQTIYSFIKEEKKNEFVSLFTILGKKHHENTLSDYLAYVLNPTLNGVGVSPLQNVLDVINTGINIGEKDSIDIIREYTLRNNRRIDFLIKINEETVIGIEHKVFSEEHGDQTNDYAKLLDNEFSGLGYDCHYIFLTPTGKKPLSDQFISLTYGQLISALKNVNVDYIQDIRKAILYNEFLFHLEGQFMKNDNIALTQKSILFIQNFEMLKDLQSMFQSDYKVIFDYIKSIITSYYENDIGEEWEFDFKEDRGYHKIYKRGWKKDKLDIHFELSMKPESLISGEITYMLDIEGSNKIEFRKRYSELLKTHLNDRLKNGPSKRKDTFAHKKAALLTKENLENEVFLRELIIELIKEFNCLIEPIDNAILEFSKVK